MVELAGGTAVPVPLDPDDNWRLTSEALAAAWTPATRILLINSPNNPTGRVLDDAELAAIAAFAQERDLLVFSDEMYEKILYDGQRHTSIATLPGMAERTLIFNGLSKAYAMTGWRLGYVAGPRPYLAADRKGAQPLRDVRHVVRAEGRRRRAERTSGVHRPRWSPPGTGGAATWPNG